MTEETSLTLQILLGIDEATVWEWFEIIKQAYPQMEGESLLAIEKECV